MSRDEPKERVVEGSEFSTREQCCFEVLSLRGGVKLFPVLLVVELKYLNNKVSQGA